MNRDLTLEHFAPQRPGVLNLVDLEPGERIGVGFDRDARMTNAT